MCIPDAGISIFDADMNRDMIQVNRGFDPYNHLGYKVIYEVLGIDIPKGDEGVV